MLNDISPTTYRAIFIYILVGGGGSIEGDTVVHSTTFTFCSHYRTSGHSMLNRSINCDLYYKTDITSNKRIYSASKDKWTQDLNHKQTLIKMQERIVVQRATERLKSIGQGRRRKSVEKLWKSKFHYLLKIWQPSYCSSKVWNEEN